MKKIYEWGRHKTTPKRPKVLKCAVCGSRYRGQDGWKVITLNPDNITEHFCPNCLKVSYFPPLAEEMKAA